MRTLVAEAPDPDRRPSIPNQGRFVELPPALQARWFALTRGNALTTVGRTALGEGSIIGQLKSAAPDAVVILQPPNPIYNATYYPKQVEKLEAFAKEKHYAYYDHWTAWPDYKSKEIDQYVDPESDLPTAEGAKRWAEALAEYFIAQ